MPKGTQPVSGGVWGLPAPLSFPLRQTSSAPPPKGSGARGPTTGRTVQPRWRDKSHLSDNGIRTALPQAAPADRGPDDWGSGNATVFALRLWVGESSQRPGPGPCKRGSEELGARSALPARQRTPRTAWLGPSSQAVWESDLCCRGCKVKV